MAVLAQLLFARPTKQCAGAGHQHAPQSLPDKATLGLSDAQKGRATEQLARLQLVQPQVR